MINGDKEFVWGDRKMINIAFVGRLLGRRYVDVSVKRYFKIDIERSTAYVLVFGLEKAVEF